LNDSYKMEQIIEKNETVEISKELLQNIRNLIDVANARIHWKTEELLPIGLIIKQIDETLNIPVKDS